MLLFNIKKNPSWNHKIQDTKFLPPNIVAHLANSQWNQVTSKQLMQPTLSQDLWWIIFYSKTKFESPYFFSHKY